MNSYGILILFPHASFFVEGLYVITFPSFRRQERFPSLFCISPSCSLAIALHSSSVGGEVKFFLQKSHIFFIFLRLPHRNYENNQYSQLIPQNQDKIRFFAFFYILNILSYTLSSYKLWTHFPKIQKNFANENRNK